MQAESRIFFFWLDIFTFVIFLIFLIYQKKGLFEKKSPIHLSKKLVKVVSLTLSYTKYLKHSYIVYLEDTVITMFTRMLGSTSFLCVEKIWKNYYGNLS
jgi:hypothetical protein